MKKIRSDNGEYLNEYPRIKNFMDNIIEKAKEEGYVETLFNRRRYIPELNSKNYMVRPVSYTHLDVYKRQH